MFELLYQILHQNWRYFFKTSVLISVQRGAVEDTMENEAQFTAAMQVGFIQMPVPVTVVLLWTIKYTFSFLVFILMGLYSNVCVKIKVLSVRHKIVCPFYVLKVRRADRFKLCLKLSLLHFLSYPFRLLDSHSSSLTSTSSSKIFPIWSHWTASTSCIPEYVHFSFPYISL